MLSLLSDVLNIGLNIFSNNKKKQQAKKQNELINQIALDEFLSSKDTLISKHNLQLQQQSDLLDKTISNTKAMFAKNGIKSSQSSDNLILSVNDEASKLVQQQNKLLDLNLQKLYQSYQNKIATGNLNYQNTIDNSNFDLIKQLSNKFSNLNF